MTPLLFENMKCFDFMLLLTTHTGRCYSNLRGVETSAFLCAPSIQFFQKKKFKIVTYVHKTNLFVLFVRLRNALRKKYVAHSN